MSGNKILINDIKNVKNFFDAKSYSNLSLKAFDMLQEMVVTLVLQPGATYSESELSSMLQIGRTPVREAIKKLETAMMLQVSPRSGVKVSEIRLEDCILQIEVRRPLEKLVITRAAKLAIPPERNHLAKLADMHDEVIKNHDSIGSIRIDFEFHNAIAEYARNPYAKNALVPFQLLERRLYYIQYNVEPGLIGDIDTKQSTLMRRIAEGNGNEACEIFDDMLEHFGNLIDTRLHV